jgi:cytochrome c biogenesis protein CcmG, thiol:disulfide interchange protein DsbE
MTEQLTSPESEVTTAETTNGRNPIIIFAGLMLLGAALALVLFGGDLFGSNQPNVPVVNDPAETTVLDQVVEFPTAESSVAEIPRGTNGTVDVGTQALNFTLIDLDGNSVSLKDFEGRPVIVNFWASWCAPCRIEMPELQTAYEAYQDEGLVILALNEDEPVEVARAYFEDEMGLTFTALLDDNSAIATAFGNFGTLPTTFFIDAKGTITVIHRGPMTFDQIEGYLSETISS